MNYIYNIYDSMTIYSFWLKESKLVEWHKKPSLSFIKEEENFINFYKKKINTFNDCLINDLGSNIEKKLNVIS